MDNIPLTKKTIHIATDHAGFEHKEAVLKWLRSEGCEVVDHGASFYDEQDDFPDFISRSAQAVSKNPEDSVGIVFGGSGQGEAMIANRFPNVRATVYYGGNLEIITLSRSHNNANLLSFGARFVSVEEVKKCIRQWLNTSPLTDEKYRRRNQKIELISRSIKNL